MRAGRPRTARECCEMPRNRDAKRRRQYGTSLASSRTDDMPPSTTVRDAMLYDALRIRLVEERIIALYPSDKIQSPVHLSIGQEMVAVGVCRALTTRDLLFCSYRSHAFYLAKGGD